MKFSFAYTTVFLPSALALHAARPFVVQDAGYHKLDVKVQVQLGVMSRCPDALICENLFTQVIEKVGDKSEVSLVYVAK